MNKIKIVVPVSGGKDSQACLKLAVSKYEKHEILGLFCDTQFEHPITYKHMEKIKDLYGVEIKTLCDGRTVPELVKKYGMFPNNYSRFCTDRLKIIPSKKFYDELSKAQGGFEVWLGMRSDESEKRNRRYKGIISSETYFPHEVLKSFPQFLGKRGVLFRLPVVDWSFKDIIEYLGDEINPIYKAGKGIDRVGCFPCLASSQNSQERHFKFDEFGAAQREVVLELNRNIKIVNAGQADMFSEGSGCSFCEI